MKGVWSILLFVAVFSGCAQHDTVRHPSLAYDLSAQQNKMVQDDLEFMALPVHLRSELENYFGKDLLHDGVLPVQVVIANKGEETVNFSTEGFSLRDATGGRHPFLPVEKVVKRTKRSHLRTVGWGVAFGLLGAVPSAINVEQVNRRIRADFDSRVIKSGNLVAGGMTEGTAFFLVPENISSLDGWDFVFAHRRAGDEEPRIIRYGLHGAVEVRRSEEEEAAPETGRNDDGSM